MFVTEQLSETQSGKKKPRAWALVVTTAATPRCLPPQISLNKQKIQTEIQTWALSLCWQHLKTKKFYFILGSNVFKASTLYCIDTSFIRHAEVSPARGPILSLPWKVLASRSLILTPMWVAPNFHCSGPRPQLGHGGGWCRTPATSWKQGPCFLLLSLSFFF